ncbi:aminotransferase class V-fold PLP-dependent enzyme [Pirellulales bacterium]|nr:aminotransferase class V-fold PLP-dependent enzyme [Pirellulales bacterium]
MPARVYLDTARMGRVSPAAMVIQTDYLRFAAIRGCPEVLQDLLKLGGAAWPEQRRRRYPALADWEGVGPLKARLRAILGARNDDSVLLTSRPRALMELASHLLFRKAETVLVSDVGWPSYHEILHSTASRLGRQVAEVPLREMIHSGVDTSAVSDAVAAAVRESGADSLFLPAISHDGIQLPIYEIVRAIARDREPRFFVVDGAQHTAHGAIRVRDMNCDFYLGGAHKWLRGLYPLGVGVYGRANSRQFIGTTVRELQATGMLGDPLLRLSGQLEADGLDGVTETVNISAMLSAHGAARDARAFGRRTATLGVQLKNAEAVGDLARRAGWHVVRSAPPFRSGIVLLKPQRDLAGDGARLRAAFESRGVVCSAYDSGHVRLSMPRRLLDSNRLATLHGALESTVCA